jgi:hypothetical protein
MSIDYGSFAESLIVGDLAERDRALGKDIASTLEKMNARGILSSGIAAQAVIDSYTQELRPRADVIRRAFSKQLNVHPPASQTEVDTVLVQVGGRIDAEFARLYDGLQRRLVATQTGGLERGFPSHFEAQRDWAVGEVRVDAERLLKEPRAVGAAPTVATFYDRVLDLPRRYWFVGAVVLLAIAVTWIGDLSDGVRAATSWIVRSKDATVTQSSSHPGSLSRSEPLFIPSLDTARVSVLVNGLHGQVAIRPGDSYFYAWRSRGVTACQMLEPVRSGVSRDGQSGSILPGHTWYPTPDRPVVLKVVCTDGTTNSFDSATVRLTAPVVAASASSELQRLGHLLGADSQSADSVIAEGRKLTVRLTDAEDRARLSVLLFDAYRLRGDLRAACSELTGLQGVQQSMYSRGIDARLVNYCSH